VPNFIYYIELELHDRNVCHAHLCSGLTRIDLSFLKNLRSICVIVIGLELLSLACPGLGLGQDYVHQLYLCHCILLWLFDPIRVENRIWGDRIGTCPV
jgi:hypothetical protein